MIRRALFLSLILLLPTLSVALTQTGGGGVLAGIAFRFQTTSDVPNRTLVWDVILSGFREDSGVYLALFLPNGFFLSATVVPSLPQSTKVRMSVEGLSPVIIETSRTQGPPSCMEILLSITPSPSPFQSFCPAFQFWIRPTSTVQGTWRLFTLSGSNEGIWSWKLTTGSAVSLVSTTTPSHLLVVDEWGFTKSGVALYHYGGDSGYRAMLVSRETLTVTHSLFAVFAAWDLKGFCRWETCGTNITYPTWLSLSGPQGSQSTALMGAGLKVLSVTGGAFGRYEFRVQADADAPLGSCWGPCTQPNPPRSHILLLAGDFPIP